MSVPGDHEIRRSIIVKCQPCFVDFVTARYRGRCIRGHDEADSFGFGLIGNQCSGDLLVCHKARPASGKGLSFPPPTVRLAAGNRRGPGPPTTPLPVLMSPIEYQAEGYRQERRDAPLQPPSRSLPPVPSCRICGARSLATRAREDALYRRRVDLIGDLQRQICAKWRTLGRTAPPTRNTAGGIVSTLRIAPAPRPESSGNSRIPQGGCDNPPCS
jgi:hypothetical protein